MIKSMTAFARCTASGDYGSLVWEIRSVNHRYLDAFIKMPEDLRQCETRIRGKVGAKLNRGKVECVLRYKAAPGFSTDFHINDELVKRLLDAEQKINANQRLASAVNPFDILQWPGVIQEQERDLAPLVEACESLMDETLSDLIDSRVREGERLKALIMQRVDGVGEVVSQVRQRMPVVIQKMREKISTKLGELQADVNNERFEQEMVYLVQKMDVDEELDRIESHLKEIRQCLEKDEAVGRRLDFLMQELNREANTLGSKSADIETTQASVELKVLIEQMREQIQNIE